VVDANLTLSTLVKAIPVRSNLTYAFTDINPVDDQDGGEPGENIRVAYLYNPGRIDRSTEHSMDSEQEATSRCLGDFQKRLKPPRSRRYHWN
jgi:hypothetical protein